MLTCSGCLWSSRAYFVDVPTAAVPAISGATVAGLIFPALTKASTSEALISHLYSLPQVQIIGPSSIKDIYASNTLRSSVPAVVFALSASYDALVLKCKNFVLYAIASIFL